MLLVCCLKSYCPLNITPIIFVIISLKSRHVNPFWELSWLNSARGYLDLSSGGDLPFCPKKLVPIIP